MREKVIAVNDPNVEGFEGVVDDFVDSVAAFKAIDSFRKKKKKIGGSGQFFGEYPIPRTNYQKRQRSQVG